MYEQNMNESPAALTGFGVSIMIGIKLGGSAPALFRRNNMSRRKRRGDGLRKVLIALIVILIAAIGVLLWLCFDLASGPQAPVVTEPIVTQPPATEAPATEPTTQPTTAPPEPEHVVSTATILSTGDLLMHGQLITDARQADGSYDFSYIFPYITEYVTAADYAVANLETTLAGTAKPYQGNPMFNCPDELVDAAKAAGFDMLLTTSNHSYDSQQAGFERTIRTIREKGLTNLGTMLSADEPKYTVQDINGIRIGMIAYTYEDSQGPGNPPALNYNPMQAGGYDLINCFRHSDPDSLYTHLDTQMELMRADGAEAIVVYLHWGQEYKLEANASQKEIARKLCDMGVDVIIGGHPHVVEPIELLESTVDPNHRTVCLYSMGNAVSNQRLGKISNISTAHTEDGVLFSITFSKYSDGTVYLEDVDLIPTWVRAIDSNGSTVVRDSGTIRRYEILPLEDSRRSQWAELFGIDESTLAQCTDSWQRTMDIVGEGLRQSRDYLSAEKTAREANYLWLAQNAA